MDASGHNIPTKSAPVWREPAFWAAAALVLAVYFTRLSTLTIRGEESRWANVAREMIASGDWVVPREQGEVFANRPPLVNWCLATAMLIAGNQDPWTLRLPSALATLAATLLIYACGRAFLSTSGALAAAVMFATMGQVLQLGGQAETEPIFTLCVAGSLLGWLALCVRRRPAWKIWCVGYLFAALAGLAKGPQGPIYFVGATWLFTLVFDRRLLLARGHLLGIAIFVAMICAWQIPFVSAVGAEQGWAVWGSQAGARFRFQPDGWERTLRHMAIFPWEVAACMLPWSIFLLGYFDHKLRNSLGDAKRPVQFLMIAALVGLAPLIPAFAARGRYYMPLYPCVALLAAVVVERSWSPECSMRAYRNWRILLLGGAAVSAVLGIGMPLIATAPQLFPSRLVQPLGFAVAYAIAALLIANLLLRAWRRPAISHSRLALFGTASLCGLSFTGAVINSSVEYSVDTHAEVSRVVGRLPPDAELVSFEPVHHLFAYHLSNLNRSDVRIVTPEKLVTVDSHSIPEQAYFCLNSYGDARSLPFAWEQVGVVTVDRNRYDTPRDYVVVGRRVQSIPIADEPQMVRRDDARIR